MATFVLVHGGALGGWSWQAVRGFLHAAGHETHAPSLTGLGDRAHLAGPAIGLETHLDDIANLLRYEDLREVVLVGFSYGGLVVAGVADRCAERVHHLVFVDALVPVDGESAYVHLPPDDRAEIDALRGTDAWVMPLSPNSDPRLTPQPLRTLIEPVHLTGAWEALPATFVRCTEPRHPAIALSEERARARPDWRYRELACSHGAPKHRPRELADLLIEAAEE